MGKKILTLLLCLLFVSASLVACGETQVDKARDYINDPNNQINTGRESVTLNFYVPCRFDPNTEESQNLILKMQDDFNSITEASYRTKVNFTFVQIIEGETDTAKALSAYDTLVKQKLDAAACKQALAEASTAYEKENGAAPTDEQLYDYYILRQGLEDTTDGTAEAKIEFIRAAVEAADNSVDIFLTTTYDNYASYLRQGLLADLTANVSGSWRILSNPKYAEEKKTEFDPTISDVLFSNAYYCTEIFDNNSSDKAKEHNEVYYGIPVNYVVGSYKYLFVNKEMADKYYLSIDFPQDATSAEANAAALKAKDQLIAEIKNEKGLTEAEIKADYVIEMTGTYGDRFTYTDDNGNSDYYMTILTKPDISYVDICSTMFCVSAYSAQQDRAFEIIRELNSNAYLHTILQYGAKDLTYTLNIADKTITLKNNNYKMDMRYTGNCMTIYPCTNYADPTDPFYDAGMAFASSYQNLKYASLQNKDLSNPAVPVTNIYLSQLSLLAAVSSQTAGKVGTEVDTVLGDRAVTYSYRSNQEIVIKTVDGQLTITIKPKDAGNGCDFDLGFTLTEEQAEGNSITKTLMTTSSVTEMPTSVYTFKFDYKGDGDPYSGTISLTAEDFTSETKSVNVGDSTYATTAAETVNSMLDIFSDWLRYTNTGLSISDFGFTKY